MSTSKHEAAPAGAAPAPASAPTASPAGAAPTPASREHFASRLGFILISAGCAIGLGNVWRFPYITGQYGGAAFILIYLLFLVVLGLPVMVMEFAVGRASQRSVMGAFQALAPGRHWGAAPRMMYAGNMLLLMYYTVICGWMLAYTVKMATGTFTDLDPAAVSQVNADMLANPSEVIGWMLVSVFVGLFVCSLGLQNGVERITKVMMVVLLAIMVLLAVRAVTLPDAGEGLAFYLVPNFGNLVNDPATGQFSWGHLGDAVYAAMAQAFFTLSVGMGGMEIFGSRIGRERSLTGEAARIVALDTFVALAAGLIIFPACFAFGVSPDAGPSLVFVTLPSVFERMPLGSLWGALFFVFMSFAALSTVIAVFENLVSLGEDAFGLTRRQSVARHGVALAVLAIPCALGFNVWAGATIPQVGGILDIEDFLVSGNIMPIGALVLVAFCVSERHGWGWRGFLAEADAGNGMRYPSWAHRWIQVGIPALVVVILVMGYAPKVAAWLGM